MFSVLDHLSRWCAKITGAVVVAMAIALVGSLLVSIFFRYVVGHALSWPEEISLMLFAWIVLLTGSLGVREEFHVRLTVVLGKFPEPLHGIAERIIIGAVVGFGIMLTYSGFDLVKRTAEHLTPTLRLPLDLVNYSAPVCGILIILHGLCRLLAPIDPESTNE